VVIAHRLSTIAEGRLSLWSMDRGAIVERRQPCPSLNRPERLLRSPAQHESQDEDKSRLLEITGLQWPQITVYALLTDHAPFVPLGSGGGDVCLDAIWQGRPTYSPEAPVPW